jgi:hypothetical protein
MHVSRHRRTTTRTRVLVASSLTAALAVLGPTASAVLPTKAGPHAPAMQPPAQAADGAGSAAEVHRAHKPRKVHTVKVDPFLFGLHDRYLTSLGHRSTRSIRLWDAGVTWPDIEPTDSAPSTWNWAPLDAIVKAAHTNRTQVTLVLGLSPSYAAAHPTDMPDLAMYKAYLTAVMKRYSKKSWGYRGIAAYQVWNEVNITTFWTGTTAQIVSLTKAAYDVRNKVDPGALLVAPAMVTRLKFEQNGISRYYRSKVAATHKPVWKYVDAMSFNLYPLQSIALPHGKSRFSGPEDSIALLKLVRGLLHQAKVPSSLPVWNTEVNYGLGAGVAATPIPDSRQVANVMRTYLLNAANGVKRVDWYAYDMGELPGGGTLGNTLLTDPANRAGGVLTPAGKAFTRIESWMKGTLVGTATKQPCSTDRHGTYTCEIRYAHGVGRVYWNPYAAATVKLVRTAKTKVDEFGRSSKARGGAKLKVSYQPVLVTSSR